MGRRQEEQKKTGKSAPKRKRKSRKKPNPGAGAGSMSQRTASKSGK
jgi:hypothetical protein